MSILFTARQAGSAASLVPVARKLRAPLLLDLDKATPYCLAAGVPVTSVDDSDLATPLQWLTTLRPRVLVTGTSELVERDVAWWAAARALGILSVAVLDSWGSAQADFLRTTTYTQHPDYYALADEEAWQAAVTSGRLPEQCLVTGQPAFDQLRSGPLPGRALARTHWRASSKDRVVLFASSNEVPLRTLEVVRSALSRIHAFNNGRWLLVAKAHPREDPTTLTLALGGTPGTLVESKMLSRVALAGADLVIGTVTTLLAEASIAGVPTLSIRLPDEPLSWVTNLPSEIPVVYDEAGVIAWLSALGLARNATAKSAHVVPTGPSAVDQVVRLIRSLSK